MSKYSKYNLSTFDGLRLERAFERNVINYATIYFKGIDFGAGFDYLLNASNGGIIITTGNCTISGQGSTYNQALNATIFGQIILGSYTVTISNTPNYYKFAISADGGYIQSNATFSGSATGGRYLCYDNSIIQTNGAGANYFPGNAGGIAYSGGLYL